MGVVVKTAQHNSFLACGDTTFSYTVENNYTVENKCR